MIKIPPIDSSDGKFYIYEDAYGYYQISTHSKSRDEIVGFTKNSSKWWTLAWLEPRRQISKLELRLKGYLLENS